MDPTLSFQRKKDYLEMVVVQSPKIVFPYPDPSKENQWLAKTLGTDRITCSIRLICNCNKQRMKHSRFLKLSSFTFMYDAILV